MFACNDYPMTPCDWLTKWDALNDTDCLIVQQVIVDFLFPVDGNLSRCVACVRFRSLIDMDLHGRASHARQGLV